MMIETIPEVLTQMTTYTGDIVAMQAKGFGNVCAKAPSAEAQSFARQFVSWVKWGCIWVLLGAGLASTGIFGIGKVFSSGRAAQFGSTGMFWTVVAAAAFVVIGGIIMAITRNGC